MVEKNHWVMDFETLSNCFVACFIHYKTDETKIFVVHTLKNDIKSLLMFLDDNINNNEWHISFNGLAFDSQITHYIIDNKAKFLNLTGDEIAKLIYAYAQKLINNQNKKVFSDYPSWKMKIKQIDLFKLNHWDNMAKLSSLKWIQYSMDWKNVLEMPIHHNTEITTLEEIVMIIEYCLNDVESTKEIMKLSKEQIALRKNLTKEYDIDLYSASEPRISKELFSYFLTKKLNIDKKELRELRTFRNEIVIKDCILPQIQFETDTFKSVLDYFNSKVIVETKGSLDYKLSYKGVDTYYGLGGLHGAKDPGVYKAEPGYTIMTSDVTSYYPNLAIKNGFSPAHLPAKEFLEQYEWFFEERKLIPKSDPKNYVYKIILNSTYGLSNDANSFLYDSFFTMCITVNGQLWLSKLYEMLCLAIPEVVPLMQNTDGLEMIIPESKKELYLEVCKEWESMTNLQLEHDEYSKMILKDVNNYIAVYKNGKTKCKGLFEFDNLALHKNKSFLVIPKAIYEFYVNGIKPEEYLSKNTNIYDYCGAVKAKGDWNFKLTEIIQNNNNESVIKDTKLQKLNRYYISKTGHKIIKYNLDGREIQTEAGKWRQTLCNNMDTIDSDINNLDINYEYYLERIYKEIETISSINKYGYVQGTLF
jgi:hypothetical protein